MDVQAAISQPNETSRRQVLPLILPHSMPLVGDAGGQQHRCHSNTESERREEQVAG
jgi:hypothetical protein